MALISRRPEGRQQSTAPPGAGPDAEPAPEVEVTIAGPDAERLAGLVDTSFLVDLVRRRNAAATAAEPESAPAPESESGSESGGAPPA